MLGRARAVRFQPWNLVNPSVGAVGVRTPQSHIGFIKPAYDLAKKVMPKISNTEAAALNAGSIGFDGDLFTGTPSLKALTTKYNVDLTKEERSFMDNQVEVCCFL